MCIRDRYHEDKWTYEGKKTVNILIDSGSTHNFLDANLAKRLGYKMKHIALQAITTANGNQLRCQYIYRNFTWQMHGIDVVSDVLLISLWGCDLVLAIKWLATLGIIRWNFQKLKMEFYFNGRNYILRGLKTEKVHMIT